ncbi:hypothetical protein OG819_49645 [Streptomyces sp. NBC_01549]|uniref:hypothetical protein n=1 Tax=unclassified Streptomyces TaxID=2593676 RepID=UPI002258EAE2|nr:hypothetical protein [Streptomyces sp. NBC_01549]MCX4597366.1 hypothetical protein [Streptomyces sp. NBC_01549]
MTHPLSTSNLADLRAVEPLKLCSAAELVGMVLSEQIQLVVEEVVEEGERILLCAGTPEDTAVGPVCRVSSGHVHGYHRRTVPDVPVQFFRDHSAEVCTVSCTP